MLVLVVDDDVNIRDYVTQFLHVEGYTVAQADNGEAALAVLGSGLEPDIILLDIVMPVMNGNEFLERLQTQPRRPPVVVMTGFLNTLKHRHFCADVLEKPFAADALRKALSTAANGVRPKGSPGPETGLLGSALGGI